MRRFVLVLAGGLAAFPARAQPPAPLVSPTLGDRRTGTPSPSPLSPSAPILVGPRSAFSDRPAPVPTSGPRGVAAPPSSASAEGPALAENLRNFDPDAVRLQWSSHHWQLSAGGQVLKDFGPREQEARQALRLIRSLHLSQYGIVGGVGPVMEYWLVDGQAPHAFAPGLRILPLVPAGLRVEQVQGQWCLRDAQRVLFNFGQQAAEAQQALAVVRKYGFTQIGVLGPGAPAMMVFLGRSGVNPQAGLPGTQGPGATPSRRLEAPHFPRQSRAPELPKEANGNSGGPKLDGLVTPALQPLATPGHGLAHANERDEQGAAWRGEPHFGHSLGGAQKVGASAERTPFDWRRVDLRQENGDWKLASGSVVLASFGTNQHEARLALSAVRHYRFTEQWHLGSFSYYLTNGQAPRGVMLGAAAQTFQPDALAVKQVKGRYALCAGEQLVAQFGSTPDEARQLLEVIKRNRFDRLCRLGEAPGQGMTYFVRSR